MNEVTLIIPMYRNVEMLKRQVEEWNKYPPGIKVICVDDGSPEPAMTVLAEVGVREWCDATDHDGLNQRRSIELYRVLVDVPWNRSECRNIGATVATTDWIIQADIDHILPADAAAKLLEFTPDPKKWYRFPRWRVGKADETRQKDAIPKDVEYGPVHPHVDSYLVTRKAYWKTGGYNEDFSGAIGGGNEFLHRLENLQPVELLPAPIRLEVYTRDKIKDASDWSLSRDKTEYAKRRKIIESNGGKPKEILRFEWKREL